MVGNDRVRSVTIDQENAMQLLQLSGNRPGAQNPGGPKLDTMLGMLVDAVNRALKDGLKEIFRLHPPLCGVFLYHQATLPIDAIEKSLRAHQAVYIKATLSLIRTAIIDAKFLLFGNHLEAR
jgi:hypothetical protein